MDAERRRADLPRVRVSISFKIFSIAVALLLLMAFVALISFNRLRQVNDEIIDISSYDLPLKDRIRNINMHALEQEAQLEGIFRLYETTPQDTVTTQQKVTLFKAIGDRVADEIRAADRLLMQGLKLATTETDRLEFAGFKPLLRVIEKEHNDFQTRALRTITLLQQGNLAGAYQLKVVVAEEKDELKSQLIRALGELARFTEASTMHAEQHEQFVLQLNLILTLAAAILGLVGAFFLTRGLLNPLHRLLQGTQAIEEGHLEVELEIASRDEIGLLTHSFNHMAQELKVKEHIKTTFGKYIDPRIVEELIEKPDAIEMAGERRVMTVLFSDIENFTPIGERLTPQALVRLINQYLTMMSQPIKAHHGVIDKYIGDAVMAFWGPPFTAPDAHAAAACLAALDKFTKLDEFRPMLTDLIGIRQDIPDINIRVGIATGEVVVGNIGSDISKSYTVMGDTVNLASRLEGVNKQYGTRLLISEETQKQVMDIVETREIDGIQVVGKSDPVRVFEVLGRKAELSQAAMDLKTVFAQGLEAYRNQKWDEAQARFAACLSIQPGDGPSRVFIERITHFRNEPPPNHWDGVWRLTKK